MFLYHAALRRGLIWAAVALVVGVVGCLVAALVFDVDAAMIVWLNVVSGSTLVGLALGMLSARFGYGSYDDD